MKTEKFKKGLSLFLAVLMLLTMMPATGIIPEVEAVYPVMKATNAASSNGYYKYYDKITSITFLDEIKVEGTPLEQWDMSADGDGSVWGWMYLDEEGTAAAGANRYTVYVAGDGGIAPHPDSTHFFFTFKALKEIRGLENLHTGNVKSFLYWFGNCNELETADLQYLDTSSCTSMKLCFYACYKLKSIDARSWDVSNVTTLENMFSRCYALETANLSGWNTSKVTSMLGVFDMNPPTGTSPVYCLKNVDLTGWDTSNVTTMENMFRNCEALTSLDLSSFNTAKVTTMRFMFYYCKNLRYIYAGSGWTTAALKNLNDGIFNCCYAVVGQTDDQETNIAKYNEKHPSAFYPPAAEYAKFREDGGYLTNASQKPVTPRYEVTYEFIGDIIPEGVAAPDAATYEDGTIVTVAEIPSADKYIFSGWSTEDAEVVNGEFVINNDVKFVGSWTKLYKVTYEYDDNYDLPPVYPEIPDVEYWYAPGEDVPVYGVPYAPEYIFVGWKTGDAEIIGDSFLMPENDVVLYGYYKMPVNSIEISGGELTVDIGGEKVRVEVIVDPPNATFKDVIFESGDESIVTVDKDGYLTPEGVGTTTITITSADDPTKTDTVNVTVKIPVTDITVDRNEIPLNKGDTDKITVTEVKPNEATNKDVTYESSDETIVRVDENGNIIAVGDGTAIITVTSKDNKTVKERVTVTVKTPVTDITVPENDITVNLGDEQNIGAEVAPKDATYPELTYESDRPDVVKIDKDGNIIAVGDGEATITITSKDNPEVTETVKVTVKIPVTDITVDKTNVELPENGKGKVTVTVTPDNATDKGVTYESSDETVVKVDEKGNIEAVGEGEAIITVTSKDNPNATETVTVTVYKEYKVTYSYVGDVIPVPAPLVPASAVYRKGETVDVAPEAVANGYTFSGWTTNDADVVNGEFTINNDVHFVGSWEKINYYNVTYKYEGDIPADAPAVPDAKTYEEGKTVTVSAVPSVEGYTFTGWTPNGATVENGKFTVNNDVVFVGTWKKNVIHVDGITTDIEEIELAPDETAVIEVKVTPDNADNKKVSFESSDPDVVTVDKDGNIKAVNEGTAIITVKTEDGDHTVTVTVKVEKPHTPVTDITVEKNEYNLTEGDKDTIKVKVTPDNATDKDVTYESSDETVVKVDEKGNIEAVGEGEATITVTSKDDPTKKETVTVKVEKKPVPVEDVTVDRPVIELTEGGTDKITVTVTPDDADNKEVTFESSDETVVKVDEKGNIEAVGEGEATITVTSKDNPEVKETVTVKVEKKPVPVEDVTVDRPVIELTEGGTDKITVTVTPDDADNKKVTYTSSDETIVKVDEKGNIEAVKEGTATITVTTDDGKKTATVTVTVRKEESAEPDVPPVEPDEPEAPDEPEKPEYSIQVTEEITVDQGITELIYVKVTPNDGSLRPSFKSADESIAKVDEFGNVTGVSAGITTIYVSFPNGEVRPVIVTVLAPAAPGVPSIPKTHHVCFGKTDGIGWYEVSINGGDFFPQGPNSTLEVEEGSILVVRVQDMWIDDEFDFYVNGDRVEVDAANTITVVVDGYMLIGALSMDVEVPDVDESLNIFQRIIRAIKDFFQMVGQWFKGWFK